MKRLAVTLSVLGFVLGGCSRNAEPAKIGDVVGLSGLRLTVTQVVVGGDDRGPWFQVWFRMKNTADHSVEVPAAAIVCAGSADEGTPAPTPDRHYALKPGARIFVGSSAAGVMRLVAPGDNRDGGKRASCRTPAHVSVTFGAEEVTYRIPDSVVEGLNDY